MSSTVEQVKDRLSIEEVVSQYVKLKPAGQNMKANCPFHNERTPSFVISPARQTYHCFGCGVGGDIFSFVEAIEGLDFKGALKVLASKAGVEIKYDPQSKEKSDEKERLFELMEAATEYLEKNFAKNEEAQKYLKDRGFTDETIKNFRVGFAEDSWEGVLKYLTEKGFWEGQIEKAGLVIKSDKKNGYYDRFRSRIMFPISDSAGRVVAFSGRIFGIEKDDTAKYINSPETPLYNKSKVLYGYDRAKQSIRRNDFTILVEGQMDLLASHQVGFTNTVAISGTALTTEHIVLISRMSKNLVLALDGDEAGLTSAAKSARLALQSGFDVKVARIPDGSDPADILHGDNGDDKLKSIVRESKHVVEFLLDVYRERYAEDRKFKLVVEKEVIPYLSLISSKIDREHFIKKIAARLGVADEVISSYVSNVANANFENNAHPVSSGTSGNGNFTEMLVSIYMWKKDEEIKKKIVKIIGEDKFKSTEEELSDRDALIFSLEETYDDEVKLDSDVKEFLMQLRKEDLQQKLSQATTNMRSAESAGDDEELAKYMAECTELHKQLAQV
mgnify:CR=1 FL=1